MHVPPQLSQQVRPQLSQHVFPAHVPLQLAAQVGQLGQVASSHVYAHVAAQVGQPGHVFVACSPSTVPFSLA